MNLANMLPIDAGYWRRSHYRFFPEQLNLILTDSVIEPLAEHRTTKRTATFIKRALAILGEFGAVRFRIGAKRLSRDDSVLIASRIINASVERLRRAYALPGVQVETATRRLTALPSGEQARSLLPHQDGRCTYLTPSRLDVEEDVARPRGFRGPDGLERGPHVLYQGLFVEERGDALSLNPYYPLLPIVQRAYEHATGRAGDELTGVGRWLASNIARFDEAVGRLRPLGATTITLPALLGARSDVFAAMRALHTEGDFEASAYRIIPGLGAVARSCPCGGCLAPVERLFCSALEEVMGMTWPRFRTVFEFCAVTDQYDLLLANNIIMLHGSHSAGRDRRLELVHVVLEQPLPAAYETWLARMWRSTVFSPWRDAPL